MKTCRRCNELKDESAFRKCTGNRDGLQSYCNPCAADDKRARYTPKERAKRRNNLLRQYGLTHDAFETMLAGQNSECQICTEPFQLDDMRGPKGAVVDHDHRSGNVRGLLCQCCNRALGMLKDNPFTAQSAALYLLRNAA